MTPEIFSDWLRSQGQKVVRSESSYWHSEGLGVYQAFPYHALIAPSDEELSRLFVGHRAVALRYSMPACSEKGCPSYAIVFEGESYGFDLLSTGTRTNVRRGLRECTVEPITFRALVDEAWPLRLDALERQGRRLNIDQETWQKRYLSAAELPGFQAWGARVRGWLAGYVVTFQMGDCLCIIDHQSHRQFLRLKINNALTFVVSQDGLSKPGVHSLFYGLESLDAPGSVADFKLHMGYTRRPIRQRVVFHPKVAPFANRLSYRLVEGISKLQPENRLYAKARGMLRLYVSERSPYRITEPQPDAIKTKATLGT